MRRNPYRYGLTLRPASTFTLPRLPWSLVAKGTHPASSFPMRPDLPTSRRFPHGEVEFGEPLTEDQAQQFDLEPIEEHGGYEPLEDPVDYRAAEPLPVMPPKPAKKAAKPRAERVERVVPPGNGGYSGTPYYETRFPELVYVKVAPGMWRFLVIEDGVFHHVGSTYRTRAELVEDIERYARDYGF